MKTKDNRVLNNYVLNDGLHMQIHFQDTCQTFVQRLMLDSSSAQGYSLLAHS